MSCPNLITNKYEEDQLQKTFTTRAGTRRGEEGWEFFNICTLYCTPYCTLLCSQLYRWASETLKILHGCTETSQIQHGGTICRMERIDKVWTCKVCGKKDQLNKSNIKKHIEGVHLEGASYTCDLCGAIARSKNVLQVHISRKHRS